MKLRRAVGGLLVVGALTGCTGLIDGFSSASHNSKTDPAVASDFLPELNEDFTNPGWIDATTGGSSLVVDGYPQGCPDALPNQASAAAITQTTAALQCRLNGLGRGPNPSNLYLPEGTYYINAELNLFADEALKQADGSVVFAGYWRQNLRIVGHDPATTQVVWKGSCDLLPDAPKHASMFHVDGIAGFDFERLTLDGQSCAGVGLDMTSFYSLISPALVLESNFKALQDVGIVGDRVAFTAAEKDICLPYRNAGTACVSNYQDQGMVSEVSVIGNEFTDIGWAGVGIGNWNALDYWIRDNRFTRCGVGVTNGTSYHNAAVSWATTTAGAGNFHAYNNVLKDSKYADFMVGNGGIFSVEGNYSSGSNGPFLGTWTFAGATITAKSNVVVANPGILPFQIEQDVHLFLFGNQIVTSTGTVALWARPINWNNPNSAPAFAQILGSNNFTEITSIGNQFSSGAPFISSGGSNQGTGALVMPSSASYLCSNGLSSAGSVRSACAPGSTGYGLLTMDDQTNVNLSPIEPPLPPRRSIVHRTGIHPKLSPDRDDADANAQALQTAVDVLVAQEKACTPAQVCGAHFGVIYLPGGSYPISHTVKVPSGAHLQFVGAGKSSALVWTGIVDSFAGSFLFEVEPTAQVTFRDFLIDGGFRSVGDASPSGSGVLAHLSDQPGARVFSEELTIFNVQSSGLWVDHLTHPTFEMRAFQSDDVHVYGGGSTSDGGFAIFGGSINSITVGGAANFWLQDTWYEGPNSTLIRCTQDQANMVILGAQVSTRDRSYSPDDGSGAGIILDRCSGSTSVLATSFSRASRGIGAVDVANVEISATSDSSTLVTVMDSGGNDPGNEQNPFSCNSDVDPDSVDQVFFADRSSAAGHGARVNLQQNVFTVLAHQVENNSCTNWSNLTLATAKARPFDAAQLREAMKPVGTPAVAQSRVIVAPSKPGLSDIRFYRMLIVNVNEGMRFTR